MPKQAHAKKTEKKAIDPSSRPRKTTKRTPGKASAEEDMHDARDARLALREAARTGGVPWDRLKRDLGI